MRIDSALGRTLQRQEGEWTIGYAAIPGTLGKKPEDLPPETVLFVEYRATEALEILQEMESIGDVHDTGRTFAITVQGVFDGWVRPQSLARIRFLLGRQDAPGLK